MKNIAIYLISILITATASLHTFAQTPDLTVPEEIQKELIAKELALGGPLKMNYKVVYPENYDQNKKYPIILAFAGGDQNEMIVNYCYYAWFRSSLFKDYILIMPKALPNSNLREMDKNLMGKFYLKLAEEENITGNNWIALGTSNGGVAAFNFVNLAPKNFDGIVVMPGSLQVLPSRNADWAHLKILLATGENDKKWKGESIKTLNKLKPVVAAIDTITMKGQGHVVLPEYNMDLVYNKFFELK